jgi:hypothetical protein
MHTHFRALRDFEKDGPGGRLSVYVKDAYYSLEKRPDIVPFVLEWEKEGLVERCDAPIAPRSAAPGQVSGTMKTKRSEAE